MSKDNYPAGMGKYRDDPRSPDYEEPPACDECGGKLTFESDYDKDIGIIYIGYCEDCK